MSYASFYKRTTPPLAPSPGYLSLFVEGNALFGIDEFGTVYPFTFNSVIISANERLDYITVTPTDITNGFVTLAQTPADPTKVFLDVVNGCSQIYAVDFIVSTNSLNWTGLGLETIIGAGDILRVQYLF